MVELGKGKRKVSHSKLKKTKSKAKKASWKVVKNVGRRCVAILANGKWQFKKNSVCAKK